MTDTLPNQLFVPGGNSEDWNSSFTTVQTNSATWGSGGVSLTAISRWDSTSTVVESNSATWSDPSILKFTNIDTATFGSLTFLQPDIKASFDGPQSSFRSFPYFIVEKDGTVIGLRGGCNDGTTNRQYFATASNANLTDLRNTDSEYRPPFLLPTEFVSDIIDANEHGFFCLIRSTVVETPNKYYWIHINRTMNPSFHSFDDITALATTTGILTNNGSIVFCPELNWWLTVFKPTANNLSVKSLLYRFYTRTAFTEMAVYSKSVGYVGRSTEPFDIKISDSQSPATVLDFRLNLTSQHTANLRYSVVGNILTVSDLCSFWVGSAVTNLSFNYNSVFTYNTSTNAFAEVYPFPHNFQVRGNDSARAIPFFPYESTTRWHPNQLKFNLIRSPNDNNILFTTYKDWSVSMLNYKIRTYTIPAPYTWEDVLRRPFDAINRPHANLSNLITSTPTDASLLGKRVDYGYFLTPNLFRCRAYSRQPTETTGSYKWVNCNIANTNNRRVFLGLNALEVPNSITLDPLANPNAEPWMSTLTSSGVMRLKRYNSATRTYYEVAGESMTITNPALATLPANWSAQLSNLLLSDPDYISNSYTNSGSFLYHLTGNLYLHTFAYSKLGQYRKYAVLLRNNSDLLTWVGTKIQIVGETTSSIGASVGSGINNMSSGIYFATDGSLYISFTTPWVTSSAFTRQSVLLLRTNTARTDIIGFKRPFPAQSISSTFRAGVHPTFGPYLIRGSTDSYSTLRLLFKDNIGITDLNTRITTSFNEAIAAADGTGFPSDSQLIAMSLQAATGFNVYSSETPLFLNGGYFKIPTRVWNMNDSSLWLDSLPSTLASNTFRVYVTILGNVATLAFSQILIADDSTRMYIGDITTSASGILNSSTFKSKTRLGSSLFIDKTGDIGIGLREPNYQLELSRDSAAKPATSTWTVASDERLKNNIENANTDICYDVVKYLPLKRYTWKQEIYSDDQVTDRTKLGWIAQDVEKVFPKGVVKHTTSFVPTSGIPVTIEDCNTLNADQIYAALYGATQKLINVVEQQQEDIKNLKIVIKNHFEE